MGNIDIRLLQSKNITIIMIIASTVKIPISVKLSIMCLKALINANNRDITRLLLLTIIDSGKNARYRLLTNKIS